MRIKWVHFPLHPDTPMEGRSLADLFAGRGYDIPKMAAQMRARMEAEGLRADRVVDGGLVRVDGQTEYLLVIERPPPGGRPPGADAPAGLAQRHEAPGQRVRPQGDRGAEPPAAGRVTAAALGVMT